MMIRIFQRRNFHKAYDGLCSYICASKVKKPSILVKVNNVCADALIELYEAWDKPEKADEWRAKLPQTETVEQ
jgi:hypothetical protein